MLPPILESGEAGAPRLPIGSKADGVPILGTLTRRDRLSEVSRGPPCGQLLWHRRSCRCCWLRSTSGAPFSIMPFGEWTVSGSAPSPGRSVVVAGVLEHLTDEQVAVELVEGMAGDLPKATRAWLSTLWVQHLTKWVRDEGRRPDGNLAPPGAREVRTRRAPEFTPSRCCHIFGDNELIEFLLTRGYLNLRWAVLPIRQYNPPTFYCAKCKRRGLHSTRFHRDLIHDHDG